MKLVKHYLNQVEFADQLQSVAFVIFFILFLSVLFWVITGEKKMYADNGAMPLQDEEFTNNIENNSKTE